MSQDICCQYAKRDSRITYFRQPSNQGSIRNWNKTLEMAHGEYFMWASDHDSWLPNAVKCYATYLDKNPDTVLVHSDADYIDADDKPIDLEPSTPIDTTGMSTKQAFRHVLWNLKRCNAIHGMFRREALVSMGGFPLAWAMDIPLISTTALFGEIAQLDSPLFRRRENRTDSMSHDGDATRKFHLSQLDPLCPERFTGIANPYQTTLEAQLSLLLRAPVGWIQRRYFQWQARMAYRARWNVRSGSELLRRLTPQVIKSSRFVRPRALTRNE